MAWVLRGHGIKPWVQKFKMQKLRRGNSSAETQARKLQRAETQDAEAPARKGQAKKDQVSKPRKAKPVLGGSALERSVKKRKRHTIYSNSRSTAKV